MPLPVLETTRLLLRPFRLADAPGVQRLAGNRAIADTTLRIPHPYEDGMAEAWISSHAQAIDAGELAAFAITRKDSGELIGAISLEIEPDFARAALGYWLGEPCWGAGLCTEAATEVVRYGFEELRLNRIHSSCLARNPASGRVLQKVGMSEEGVLPKHTRKWGIFEDLVLYGLLRRDFQGRE